MESLVLIRFRTKDNRVVAERMLPLQELFGKFILRVVSDLVGRRIIKPGEIYYSIVMPRYDASAQLGRESVRIEAWDSAQTPKPDSRGGWLSPEQLRGEPMRYFTLELRTEPRGLVFTMDCSLSELDPFLDQIESKLVSQREISPADSKGGLVRDLIARYESADDSGAILLIVEPITTGYPSENVNNSTDDQDVDIVIQPANEILFPKRCLDDYEPSTLRKITTSPTIVVIHNAVTKEICAGLPLAGRNPASGGGVLIGMVYSNSNGEGHIVEVRGLVPFGSGQAGDSSAVVTHDMWSHVSEEQRRRFPEQRAVGWYRVLPTGPTPSTADLFVHRSYFVEPWQVLLTVGAGTGNMALFGWKGGDLIACSDCFILEIP